MSLRPPLRNAANVSNMDTMLLFAPPTLLLPALSAADSTSRKTTNASPATAGLLVFTLPSDVSRAVSRATNPTTQSVLLGPNSSYNSGLAGVHLFSLVFICLIDGKFVPICFPFSFCFLLTGSSFYDPVLFLRLECFAGSSCFVTQGFSLRSFDLSLSGVAFRAEVEAIGEIPTLHSCMYQSSPPLRGR